MFQHSWLFCAMQELSQMKHAKKLCQQTGYVKNHNHAMPCHDGQPSEMKNIGSVDECQMDPEEM